MANLFYFRPYRPCARPRSLIKHKTALGVLLPDDDPQLANGIRDDVYDPFIELAVTHMLWCQGFYLFSLHLVWNPETNTHSISHSKTKCKHSSPSRCPQMASSSTILSGLSLPPDHPHKLPMLSSPNTSTKARSLSTLHNRTPRPTRSVTPRLRRLAAPAQYITHRAPRTPPGQICLPFDYPRFFRTNGCW